MSMVSELADTLDVVDMMLIFHTNILVHPGLSRENSKVLEVSIS